MDLIMVLIIFLIYVPFCIITDIQWYRKINKILDESKEELNGASN